MAKKSTDNGHWMQNAFKNSHGQFKNKAKAAGKSTKAFANKVTKNNSKASTKTKRQASLVKTAAKINAKRKGK